MRASGNGKARTAGAPFGAAGADQAGGRREEGFALPMVLFIITMLAILGATSLIMAVYTMMNAQGTLPAAKAFDAAESGLSVAHSKLARDIIPEEGTSTPETGSLEANSAYSVEVLPDPASPEWKITSTGTYTDSNGTVYKRTLEEKVTFAGTEKYFNALDYVLFSKEGTVNVTSGTIVGYNYFRVNGNVYGKNVTLENRKTILGVGDLVVNGNVYATNNAKVRAYAAVAADSAVTVNGTAPVFPSLGSGVFANNNLTLASETGYIEILGTIIPIATSTVTINGNCYYGSTTRNVTPRIDIWLLKWYHVGGLINISGADSTMNVGTGNVPNVALPEPDYDWYRSQAKLQDSDAWSDGQHYYPGNATVASLTIDPNASVSSGWIGFCEGTLTLQNVRLNANAKGVFVAMGNIAVTHSWQLQGTTEYQAIAKGKVTHTSSMTVNLNPTDTIFIYSGYKGANDADYAVSYSLGWFRDIKGQITAKGSIRTDDADWSFLADAGVTYKKPSVPVAGFPIPFQVKSWKEVPSP